MAIKETTTITHEQMYGGPEKEILMANVTIMAGKALEKGTLMTVTGTTAVATTSDGTANAILAYDVDATATAATVYVSGRFNRDQLHAADGDTVAAHEDQLRDYGIYLTKNL